MAKFIVLYGLISICKSKLGFYMAINIDELITEIREFYGFNSLSLKIRDQQLKRYIDMTLKKYSRIKPRENLYSDISIIANQSYISLPDDFYSARFGQLYRLKSGGNNYYSNIDILIDCFERNYYCYEISSRFTANGSIRNYKYSNITDVSTEIKITPNTNGKYVINLQDPFINDIDVDNFNYNGLHIIDDENCTIPLSEQDKFIMVITGQILLEYSRSNNDKNAFEQAKEYLSVFNDDKEIGYAY